MRKIVAAALILLLPGVALAACGVAPADTAALSASHPPNPLQAGGGGGGAGGGM